jgi:hypothetical protein
MSYMASPTGVYATKTLEVAMFRWGATAQGVAATLTADASTWATSPVESGGVLTLPSGHYYALATCGLTRSSASSNVRFSFYLDSAEVGKAGQSDMYLSVNGLNCDTAECAFTVPAGSTATLELRVIGVETPFPTITADSAFVVMRSNA